ncbi:hypothetical protein SDC9_149250 [bioreactor metagenome]|uniref:Uncharacterized protein n=1 Tax=bioreactor metagenome TaxID=1076179 RepID=A0A645EJV1_9ZZZZ
MVEHNRRDAPDKEGEQQFDFKISCKSFADIQLRKQQQRRGKEPIEQQCVVVNWQYIKQHLDCNASNKGPHGDQAPGKHAAFTKRKRRQGVMCFVLRLFRFHFCLSGTRAKHTPRLYGAFYTKAKKTSILCSCFAECVKETDVSCEMLFFVINVIFCENRDGFSHRFRRVFTDFFVARLGSFR